MGQRFVRIREYNFTGFGSKRDVYKRQEYLVNQRILAKQVNLMQHLHPMAAMVATVALAAEVRIIIQLLLLKQ